MFPEGAARILLAICLPFLLYLPGWAVWLLFHRADPAAGGRALSRFFTQVGAGVAASGIFALLLTVGGVFSSGAYAACCLGFTVLVLVLVRPSLHDIRLSLPSPRPTLKAALPLLPVLVLALVLMLPPFIDVFGSWDAGVYPNIAANIVKQGGYGYRDPVVPTVEPGQRDLFYEKHFHLEDGRLVYEYTSLDPGFYITSFSTGGTTPQFFYLFPGWLAIGMAFLGARPGFLLFTLISILSVWAMFMLAREFMRRWAAAAAALFLAVNFLEVYFGKYSTSEMLAQFFFLFGLYAFVRYRRAAAGRSADPDTVAPGAARRGWWGFLAALGFGCMMLTHVDALLILPALFVLYLAFFLSRGWRALREDGVFLLSLVPFLTFTAAMAAGPYRFYLGDIQRGIAAVLPHGWLSVGVLVLLVLALAAALRLWGRGLIAFCVVHRRQIAAAACVVLVLLAAYSLFARPLLTPARSKPAALRLFNESSLERLTGYLTPLGLLLGLVGLCLFILREDRDGALVWLAGLLFLFVFLYRTLLPSLLPYQMRRFLQVALPVIVLMQGYALSRLYSLAGSGPAPSRRARLALGTCCVALAAVLFGTCLAQSGTMVGLAGFRGSYPLTLRVSASVPDDSLIVLDQSAGSLLAAPLRFITGRRVVRLTRNYNVSKAGFERFIGSYLSEGVRSYLVTVRGRGVADRPGHPPLVLVASLPYSTRTVELGTAGAREHVAGFDVMLDVYRITGTSP